MRKVMFGLLMAVLTLSSGMVWAQDDGAMFDRAGSLLVFPLVDNSGNSRTIIDIVNRGPSDVWLQGMMIVSTTPADHKAFVKEDFLIHLTAKEPFFWMTDKAYARKDANDVTTQLRSYKGYKGFCFVWAVNNNIDQLETEWNYLTGDAVILGQGSAVSYNAYAHQTTGIVPNRCLEIGREYTPGPSRILVQGIAAGAAAGLGGKLVVCNLGIDFIKSCQPDFDINFALYNQDETFHSRHVHCYQFAEYDLASNLQLGVSQVFTPKWQMEGISTSAMWTLLIQWVGAASWGGPAQFPAVYEGVVTTVVLPGAKNL
jgi:hypothetical protein